MQDTLFLDLQDTWNVVQWNVVLVAKTQIEKKILLVILSFSLSIELVTEITWSHSPHLC